MKSKRLFKMAALLIIILMPILVRDAFCLVGIDDNKDEFVNEIICIEEAILPDTSNAQLVIKPKEIINLDSFVPETVVLAKEDQKGKKNVIVVASHDPRAGYLATSPKKVLEPGKGMDPIHAAIVQLASFSGMPDKFGISHKYIDIKNTKILKENLDIILANQKSKGVGVTILSRGPPIGKGALSRGLSTKFNPKETIHIEDKYINLDNKLNVIISKCEPVRFKIGQVFLLPN